MSHDKRYTVESLRDLFSSLRAYFAGVLTGIVASGGVRLAFTDERGNLESDRTYPAATIYLYDVQYDNSRRLGGGRVSETNAGGETSTVKKEPSPVSLYFQLDTYADKVASDWSMLEKLLPQFGARYSRVTVPADAEAGTTEKYLYLIPESIDNLDAIAGEGLWRKSFRFRVDMWFEHPEAAQQKYLVLQRRLSMEGLTWTMDDPPE